MTEIRFDRLAHTSDESESIDFFPAGYKRGRTKFIFVTGGVLSGLGKGIFAASLASLLKRRGFSVIPVKLEGYLNIDSGTLNPLRHGEVFVLKDGTECDLDLGNYERFLDQDLSADSFITAGQLYSSMLDKERAGSYLGRDVLVIPHLTGEIKRRLRQTAMKVDFDWVIVEIGGTVGDYENLHYLEAARQLRYDEGANNVLFCHLTLVPFDEAAQEHKSKPTQHSVRALLGLGIQPDVVVARSEKALNDRVKEKVSLFCNIPHEQVISNVNLSSVYELPDLLAGQDLDNIICKLAQVAPRPLRPETKTLSIYHHRSALKGPEVNIAIVGKYNKNPDSYYSIYNAIQHVEIAAATKIKIRLVDAEDINDAADAEALLADAHGVIVPGGFGARGIEGMVQAVRYAREKRLPYLGLCLGFQILIIEAARSLGLSEAQSTEFRPETPQPIIYILPTQRAAKAVGGSMRLGAQVVRIQPGTKAHALYSATTVTERFRHRYEFNQDYEARLEELGLIFSGESVDGNVKQIAEYKDLPFFMGVQYHAEFTSRPLRPHPLFIGFIEAARECVGNVGRKRQEVESALQLAEPNLLERRRVAAS